MNEEKITNKKDDKIPIVSYVALVVALFIIGFGYYWWSSNKSIVVESNNNIENKAVTEEVAVQNLMHTITIETNKGTIIFQTYDKDAPIASKNFVDLANKGFYDSTIFHRVIKGFMIQGGDPTGTGRGGPGYAFQDELDPTTESYKMGYMRGVVAMANAGPNTNGSQFFIMHADYPLPHSYTIFGKVISGMDVVDAIATSKVDANDKPLENITIKKVTISQNK